MKTNQRLLLCALAVVLFSLPAYSQDREEKLNMTFTVKPGSTLMVSNISGNVSISGWDQDTISVVALKRAKAPDAAKKLELVRVTAALRGNDNRVICESQYPNEVERKRAGIDKRNFNVSVEWTIRVPRSCSIEIPHLISGNLGITDVNGRIDAKVVSGEVRGKNVGGAIGISVTAGNIIFDGVNGTLHIDGVSGDIEIAKMTGRAAVKTTSGQISVDAIDLEGLELVTTSGDVSVDTASPITFGTYKIRAFSGDVTFNMPDGSAFSCWAKTDSGTITSAWPLEITRKMGRHSANGTVGGGGADISLTTFSGNIGVKK